jgi:FMN reductase (NADPH)
MNAVIDSLLAHRTVRSFRPDPIDEETLRAILEAGTRAATHFQPYSFLVIDDADLLKEIVPLETPLALFVTVDLHRFQEYMALHDAEYPINSSLNLFLRYWDAIVALQNVVVAAESLGLGTVYLGHAPGIDLHETLRLPENVFPAGLVLIGHPAEEPPKEPRYRVPLEAVVHRNQYVEPTADQLESWYGRYGKAFAKQYEGLAEDKRAALSEQGVKNGVQFHCHSTAEVYQSFEASVIENLRRGGFHVADWG